MRFKTPQNIWKKPSTLAANILCRSREKYSDEQQISIEQYCFNNTETFWGKTFFLNYQTKKTSISCWTSYTESLCYWLYLDKAKQHSKKMKPLSLTKYISTQLKLGTWEYCTVKEKKSKHQASDSSYG